MRSTVDKGVASERYCHCAASQVDDVQQSWFTRSPYPYASCPPVRASMSGSAVKLPVSTSHTYAGAGHGFLRQQEDRDGANLKASQEAWPRTIAF